MNFVYTKARIATLIIVFIGTTAVVEASITKIFGLTHNPPKIRVRIEKNLDNVFISGTDISRKFHTNKKVKTFPGRKSVKFKCLNLSKKIGFMKPVLLASLASPTGLISFEKEKYKGLVHIISSIKNNNCDVVIEANIEDYISSLLSKEMNAAWPLEVLKAQAVAARTYAIHKINTKAVVKKYGFETFYHVESSEKHQVTGSYFDATKKTNKASKETIGMVLTDSNDKVVPAFFHAGCGGRTLRPDHVWQNKVKSYKTVDCHFCQKDSKRNYNNLINKARFNNFIKWAVKKGFLDKRGEKFNMNSMKMVPNRKFSRTVRFYIGDEVFKIKKSLFRRFFGRTMVPSNNFEIKKIGNKFIKIVGSGLGHGVGMCQLGALDLAKKGWDYKRILSYYFPEHKLTKLYQ